LSALRWRPVDGGRQRLARLWLSAGHAVGAHLLYAAGDISGHDAVRSRRLARPALESHMGVDSRRGGEVNAPGPGARDTPAVATALLGVALVGVVLVLMRLAAPVLTPILLALFLTALAAPAFRRLQRKGLRRGPALLAIVVVVVLGGLALVGLGLLAVHRLQAGLASYSDALTARMAELLAPLESAGVGQADQNLLSGLPAGALAAAVGAVASVLANLLFSVVLTAFLLLEAGRFGELFRSGLRDRPFLGQIPEVAGSVVRYFGVRTRLNLITGAGVAALLLLLGIDYWPLWGVVTFFLSYIPYIGLTVSMIPPVLLGFAEHGLPTALLIVVGTVAGNLLVENVLEPTMTGRALDLSPTVVFVSFFFWTWLLGPAGMLMSMPITVLLMLTLDCDERTRWAARLIGRRASAGKDDEAGAEQRTPDLAAGAGGPRQGPVGDP
jgi:predicted PurR-regulated permease PerM